MNRTWTLAGLGVMACHHQPPKSMVSKRLTPCPEQSLTAEEVAALRRRGVAAVDANRMGEHHAIASLDAGLPLLKQAALHGDVVAMGEYASLVTWYGFIDNDGARFMGRTPWKNAQEGLMFILLATHRGRDVSEDDQEAFRVLLNPATPFPSGFLDDPSGTAWLIQGWPPETVDQVRRQAHHWKDCWPQ